MTNMHKKSPGALAVVGFSDYQGKIDCVDAWFDAGDPRANAYSYIIEEAGDHIRVREMTGYQRTFLVSCGKEDQLAAIRSLALLLNKIGFIAMDHDDVFRYMPSVVDYYVYEITGDACLHDLRQALRDAAAHLETGKRPWVQIEGDLANELSNSDHESIVDKIEKATGNTGERFTFMYSLQLVEERNPPVIAFWLPSQEEKNSLKKMNVLRKILAVVGFSEYQSQTECVDGWFAADDPRAEEYEIVIEKAGEHIRVRETYEPKGAFLVNCRKEHRSEALQSLAFLFHRNHIGFDWYDVFHTMPRVVDYHFCEVVGDACLNEMKPILESNLENIREHLKQDRVPWFQFEHVFYDDQNENLFHEVLDKLDSLIGNQFDCMISAPIIEKRITPVVAFWLPSPEKKNGPEN